MFCVYKLSCCAFILYFLREKVNSRKIHVHIVYKYLMVAFLRNIYNVSAFSTNAWAHYNCAFIYII